MKILPRLELLKLVKSNPKQISAIVIHEAGKYADVAEIVNLCKQALVLEMDDVISERNGAPTRDHVEKALACSDYDYVSCKMGVSRSAALCFLIECKKTSSEEAIKLLDEKKHFPNELVMKHGMDILGVHIRKVVSDFYKKVALHRGWSWQPHNLVTKYFKDE